ncbi:I20L2 protein, partial [Syrrhaptes paradoxus]|nr:I20L2 protein [Syrrhaptes paradoxus]
GRGPRRKPGTGGKKGEDRGQPSPTGTKPSPGPAPVPARNGSTGAKRQPRAHGAAKRSGKGPGGPPRPNKVVAVDCEMVGTGPGGSTSALARCSLVGYDGD